ncbi:MAG: ferrous iron transport protein A [Clostridiales bacterium]|nr:ferrous iron transport protein A [Clostridiales bacterium]
MSFNITLNNVPLNMTVKIKSIKSALKNKNRLTELGFTEGCEITPLYISPLGDPTAYCIRGTIIALRGEDAENIIVAPPKEV